MLDGHFNVTLYWNVDFTDFEEALQTRILAGLASRLAKGGVLSPRQARDIAAQ